MNLVSAANDFLCELGGGRPCISGLTPSIFTNGGPNPQSLVEISGKKKSGKTRLLTQLMAHCLTRCEVILINISQKIDIQVLGKLVQDVVKDDNPEITPVKLKEMVEKCMDSFHIINCFSSQQFRMAIKALDHHILIDSRRVSLVAVDSLCEFYWFELPPDRRVRKYKYYMSFLKELNKISKRFHVCCMYTVDSSFIRTSYRRSSEIYIDYKLHLNYLMNGSRTLNQKKIVFSESGVHFPDQDT